MENAAFIVAACSVAIGMLLTIAQCWASNRFTKASILRTSRFPLFEVRDRLRRLVIDGTMREDDKVWDKLHCAINRLLHLRNKRDLVTFLEEYVSLTISLASDERLKEQFERYAEELATRAKEVPELGEIEALTGPAMFRMFIDRTSRFRFRLFLWRLKLTVLVSRFRFRALRSMRLVRGDLRDRVEVSKVVFLCRG